MNNILKNNKASLLLSKLLVKPNNSSTSTSNSNISIFSQQQKNTNNANTINTNHLSQFSPSLSSLSSTTTTPSPSSLISNIFRKKNVLSYFSTSTSSNSVQDVLSKSPFLPLTVPHPKLKEFNLSNQNDNNNSGNENMDYKEQITTLPNGIKVISKQTHEEACAIGLYVNTGSKFETPENRGVFNLLQKMTFKATKNNTTPEIVRSLEDISLNAMSVSSREIMQISIEVLRKDVENILKIFSDQIKCPLFEQEELKEQIESCIRNWESLNSSADSLLPELLQRVAFGDEGLGSSIFAAPNEYESITREKLFEAIERYYVGKNIVVSGTGINHGELVQMVQKYFSDIPYQRANTPTIESVDAKTVYNGGTMAFSPESDEVDPSWIVAFPFKGLASITESNDIFTAFVLQSILGGGSAYSTGGPGKGMQSRLNLNVVYRLHKIKHCSAFFSVFNQHSLFGVNLNTTPGSLGNAIELLLSELLFFNQNVTMEELNRAKRSQKSQILTNLELRGVLCDDMARQLVGMGQWKTPEEVCKAIDSVTMEDVKALYTKIMQSKPSVVVLASEKDSVITAEDFNLIVQQNLKLLTGTK
ncbi:hypothetical protein CYY_000715 [Polysphondylium violaceum]|uniref:Mitochondrial processing peptidase alpha subunit n=1 Tax=Polysphondylium violaceum TaxID=133409 RepID=A0A8J4Q1B9_9MYCE|nr:hypothetical protein CYY_000715 [Polysphondylium violaceum]